LLQPQLQEHPVQASSLLGLVGSLAALLLPHMATRLMSGWGRFSLEAEVRQGVLEAYDGHADKMPTLVKILMLYNAFLFPKVE
jgi:hypothetical protein